MRASAAEAPARPVGDQSPIIRWITLIMAAVVGLTFLFGFGNVLNLALRLGVPVWVAPLVAPAVDLSILGLLLAIRHLVTTGAAPHLLRPARRLLVFCSVVTLALNVAEPLVSGHFGRAAFDAVGPLLLIGWAEVGPGLLQAVVDSAQAGGSRKPHRHPSAAGQSEARDAGTVAASEAICRVSPAKASHSAQKQDGPAARSDDLLARAREEDARHRAEHQRPISAEGLRRRLKVGASRSRRLVAVLRAECRESGEQPIGPRRDRHGPVAAEDVSGRREPVSDER
ncbi:hypothetical protein M8C13_08690 [Crossiella sp. SN42]|uniref:hypothetical protein n=1 Tax=Crossiella sp. SN42 TaxID=2944808 RepID=UPI00207CF9D0|nr:hypothetical protein [Crossiella sp. SN42]MCO1575832.1 hypothetical protein [Crossiella sp. SN42]